MRGAALTVPWQFSTLDPALANAGKVTVTAVVRAADTGAQLAQQTQPVANAAVPDGHTVGEASAIDDLPRGRAVRGQRVGRGTV